jgi:hypothetical protein
MPGNNDSVGGLVETAVAFVVRRITEEDTQGGAGCEFVWCSCRQVRITTTTKDTKMFICWRRAKKSLMGSVEVECLGRENVEEHGGSRKCLNPIRRWDTCLKQ